MPRRGPHGPTLTRTALKVLEASGEKDLDLMAKLCQEISQCFLNPLHCFFIHPFPGHFCRETVTPFLLLLFFCFPVSTRGGGLGVMRQDEGSVAS